MHRGGGNTRITSHNQSFSLIEGFNNLALWGEKKFVSELKRTYKFQRGVNNRLDCHANQTRILSKEYSFVAGDYVRSTARNDVNCHTEGNSPKYRMVGKIYQCLTNVDKRLRNKCAMIDYGHPELVSVSCGLNPSPAFQAPSPQVARGKVSSVGNMKENIFSNMVYSLFTTHHSLIYNDTVFSRFTSHFSLKQAGATHVALCDSVGSYFRHWCGAFTLAEVLITLGIIGVVAAMTMPALIANTKKSEISAKLKKFNTTMAQCVLLSEQDNGPAEEWSNPGEYDTFDLDKFFKTYLAPYIKYSSAGLKTEYGSKRYYVYLLDGGYFYLFKGNCVDIVYDVNGSKKPNASGRDTFRFLLCGSKSPEWCDGRHFCPMYSTSAHTREEKIQDCIKGDRGSGCTGLLEYDGWEFKKDYPIRL